MGFPLFHLRLWTSETMYVLVRVCVNAIFFLITSNTLRVYYCNSYKVLERPDSVTIAQTIWPY